ncbi:MAG TPA: archaellin/type IV pilin N-terminal domain-containing protein [Candidatus Nanoarchaeia archaeon]|nr:archaellin/type IV pilin N-terminal domain-containing protein [Candidatus Nanoarchaeia archaeon]
MNRKAITPVIAVVLLLMMTVAAAGAAFFWITTIQSRIQGQVGTQAAQSAASSRLVKVISAECGSAVPVSVNITIQNVGELTVDSGKSAVVISDAEARIIATNTSLLNNNLDAGDLVTMKFFIGTSLNQNKTYGVKVTLPGGSEQTSTCVAK